MVTLFIDWNPSVEAFSIGSFVVRWYSLCWCVGLLLAYLIVQRLYRQQEIEKEKFEPLFMYCFVGVLIGARLGHCIFYEPQHYLTSATGFIEMILPLRKDYNGEWHFTGYEGLASHGGTIGLIIAMVLYWRRTKLKPWFVMDNIAIAVPFTACFIRLGNLMNSEILGKPSDMPWAFVFHSHESMVNGQLVPRHPAQLYEAIAYILIGIVGIAIYHKWHKAQGLSKESPIAVGTGFYFGYCLATIFTFRFFIEFLKVEQVEFEQGMLFDMGQLLSIPFIIIGIYCMVKAKKKAANKARR